MTQVEHRNRWRVMVWCVVGLAALALVSGALTGCVPEMAAPTPTPTRTPSFAATALPTDPPQPTMTPIGASLATTDPGPAPTATPEALPENTNPLTGEVVADSRALDRIPVAIKVDNFPPDQVWPQNGLNGADLVYEHYNEGWFSTRFTAIYLGQDPEKVGSVRSGRLIDMELPAMYKAAFACSGFSNGVLALMQDSDLYPDQIASESLPATLSPSPFYRDETRIAPFNMYTNPARVRAWADGRGFSGRQDLRGMTFSQEPPEGGSPATYLQIPWTDLNAEWTYDEPMGRYLRWSDGQRHMDALDNSQISAANVVVLYVSQWDSDIVEDPHWGSFSIRWALWNHDNPYRPAVLFRDGQRFDGMWHRPERADLLTLTDEDGNPLPFKVGNTFFQVIPLQEDHWIDIVAQ